MKVRSKSMHAISVRDEQMTSKQAVSTPMKAWVRVLADKAVSERSQ
jgi:hypothetical protein